MTAAGAAKRPARGWRLPPTPYGARGGRLSVTDLIVTIGGVLLLVAGWALLRAHDGRLEQTEVAGLALARPAGWLPLPVPPGGPALAQWTDDDGFGATLALYAAEGGGAGGDPAALVVAGLNPAAGEPAYTPLRSEPTAVGGAPAVRSDYAYARAAIASSTPPEVVLGRQLTWAAGDRLLTLALEAPQPDWPRIEPLFAPLAAAAAAGGGS